MLTRWDVVEHLKTLEDMQWYIDACLEEDDFVLIDAALKGVARAESESVDGKNAQVHE